MLDISIKAGTPTIIDGPVQINSPRQVHKINVSDESPLNRLPYRSLNNTTSSQAKENVKDLKVWGDPDCFKLISKASSEEEGWMKSTKAMEIKDVGCVIQVTTREQNGIAEALVFVPGTRIIETQQEDLTVGRLIGKILQPLPLLTLPQPSRQWKLSPSAQEMLIMCNSIKEATKEDTTSQDECCEPIEADSETKITDGKTTKNTTKGNCIKCFLNNTDLAYIVRIASDGATFDTQKDDILPQGVCVACGELEADLLRIPEYEPSQRSSKHKDHEDPSRRALSASEHDFIFRSLCIGNTKENNPNIKLSNQILREMQKYVTKSIPRKIAFAVRISSIYYDQNTDEKWYYMYLEAFENVPIFANQSFIDLYYPEDGDYLVVSATGQIHTISPDRLREEYEILTDISEADKISEMLYFE